MTRIRRALLSVSDKTGLLGLAEALHRHGVEMVSTGGTASMLREAGFPVIDVADLTGHAEAFAGRVKTLSFEIASALLFDRGRDAAEAERLGIKAIDLLVCNLYPFAQTAATGANDAELIEQIDIGGVTLIRAAAKNSAAVSVLVSPNEYEAFVRELTESEGLVSPETRRRLMRSAFNHTADYDSAIAETLDRRAGSESLRLAFEGAQQLRYGENPHQKATVYHSRGSELPYRLHQGKELSYTNLLDLNAAVAAVDTVSAEGRSACAIVKHGNPCGLALADSSAGAFDIAWEGDPVSAFGSVVAFSGEVDVQTVKAFRLADPDRSQRRFIEIVAARTFAPGTAEMLAALPSLRMVEWQGSPAAYTIHHHGNLLLRQEADTPAEEPLNQVTATTFQSDPATLKLAQFGIRAVSRVVSNAIVIVRATAGGTWQLLGMGAGQPNRVTSVRLAIEKARENLHREAMAVKADVETHFRNEMKQAILVSDAFFPFPDSIDACAEAGIRRIIQPGGSKRDPEVIARADELVIAMALTGRRHFRH